MAVVLLDSCVWGGALLALSKLGYDAIWSGSWAKDPGDMATLAAAHFKRRILVTSDKGFRRTRHRETAVISIQDPRQ